MSEKKKKEMSSRRGQIPMREKRKKNFVDEGRVLMKEEVFITWVASSLIIAVMGSQFTGRDQIDDEIRVVLDVLTMTLAFLVLLWALLSYTNLLSEKIHKLTLYVLMISLLAYYVYVAFLTITLQI